MAHLLTPDRCTRAQRLAACHSLRDVSMITGIARSTLTLLKARGWKPKDSFRPSRPRPTDFAIQCRHMTWQEMADHYRASHRTLAQWRREVGQ